MTNYYEHQLVHPTPGSPVHIPFGFCGGQWTPEQVVTAQRLIDAYHHTLTLPDTALKAVSDTDLWTGIVRQNLAPLIACLERRDPENLSRLLVDFGSSYLWFGGISTGLDGFSQGNLTESQIAYSYWDQLLNLGEALGVLCAENPEQQAHGNWGRNTAVPPHELIAAIEQRLGLAIVPPTGVLPVVGIVAPNGLLHYRHVNALYTATRIHALLAERDGVIAEYGGGLGLVAYYSRLMGHRDYTLFDLPVVNVISGWFLLGALGPAAVSLEGEEPLRDSIKIAANWTCENKPDKCFQMSVNQDSFPEVNRTIFDAYVQNIERTTSTWFLSINHEVEHTNGAYRHLNVSRTFSGRQQLARLYRSPYWIRKGYVEELYQVR